jgi:hypothetical protein
MHNCKTTGDRLIDLALDESRVSVRTGENARLLAELSACSACRAEYASLRRTLGVVDQASQSAAPAESYWSGYHSRLTQRLEHATATDAPVLLFQPRASARAWSILKGFAGASVRIPVPVVAALFIFFGLSLFLVMQARGQAKQKPLPPATPVETRTLEVPVIKERVVTRVVYVAKTRRVSPAQPEPNRTRNFSGATARLPKEPANKTALSLSGFRPTDQVKLTIIRGSYHDEK